MKFIKDPNWHVREEILLLLQEIFMQSSAIFDYSYYKNLINKILEIIDDIKPKV